MSEEKQDAPKITSIVKPKDPRRVEAGKQLAKISKAAKERKMHDKIEKGNHSDEDSAQFHYKYISIVGLYYTRKNIRWRMNKLNHRLFKKRINNLDSFD